MIRRIASSVAGFALAAGILAGCAVSPPSISRAASSDLQAGVVAVAESAAAGDAATALARLDELEQTLAGALAAGDVTAERAAEIQTALDVVRGDLQAPAATPTPTVEPAPVETIDPGVGDDSGNDGGNDGGGNDGGGNDGGGNDGGDDSGGNGEDNSGPGNNNGNGKGKGNDD